MLPDPPVAALIDASADAELLVIGMIGGSGAEIVLGSVTLDVTTGRTLPGRRRPRRKRGRPRPRRRPSGAGAARHRVRRRRRSRRHRRLRRRRPPRQRSDRRARARDAGHLGLAASAVHDRLAPWRSDHPDVEVTVRIGQGNPGLALLHESTDARHIVLGTRGRHAAVRAVLGSVSRFVLRHSLVPVTVVPRSLSPPGSTVPAAVAGDPHDRSQLW